MKTHALVCSALLAVAPTGFSQPVSSAPEPPQVEAPAGEVGTEAGEEETDEQPALNLITTDWGFTMDLKSVEGAGLGLDYTWNPFPNARTGADAFEKFGWLGDADWGLRADLQAEGFLGFQSDEDDNTPRALSIEGNLFINLIAAEVIGQDWWVDIGVSAFQLEADQSFDQINYVFRPYVLAPIPGSHLLSGWLQRLTGVARTKEREDGGLDIPNARPIYLRAGYSFVSEIEGGERPAENRTEIGVTWRIKLIGDSFFDASYRHFIEADADYGFLELTLSVPLKKDLAAILKFVDGELPPSLAATQAVSAGFSISF